MTIELKVLEGDKMGSKLTQDKYIKRAKELHGDHYDLSNVNYKNYRTKIEVKCNKCGTTFYPAAGDFIRKYKPAGCGVCSKSYERRKGVTKKMDTKSFTQKAKMVHGDKFDYSLVVYKGSRVKVPIKCKTCGEVFFQEPRIHLSGRSGCRFCTAKRKIKRLTTKEFIKKAREIHGNKYDYSKTVYGKTNKELVTIICPIHGEFRQPAYHHLENTSCPECKASKGEEAVARVLEKYDMKYEREFKLPNSAYRYDFYVPDYNILIEYDGMQHFKPIKYFGGLQHLKYTKQNDKEKNMLAKDNHLHLIHIPYTEYTRLEQFLIKKLKSIYKYWLVIDDHIKAYKDFQELCDAFNLPKDTKVGEELEALKQKIVYKLLF